MKKYRFTVFLDRVRILDFAIETTTPNQINDLLIQYTHGNSFSWHEVIDESR